MQEKDKFLEYAFISVVTTSLFVFSYGNFFIRKLDVLLETGWVCFLSASFFSLIYISKKIWKSNFYGYIIFISLLAINFLFRSASHIFFTKITLLIVMIYAFSIIRVRISHLIASIMIGILGGLIIFYEFLLNPGIPFDGLYKLHLGLISKDVLFHSSISAMLKNYYTVSTGLNGLVEVTYYPLSHLLTASISILSNVGLVQLYDYISMIILDPLLIYVIGMAGYKKDNSDGLQNFILRFGLSSILILLLPAIFKNFGTWNYYFVAHSYSLAIILLTISQPVLFKDNLSKRDYIFVILISSLMAITKISVAILYSVEWFGVLMTIFWIKKQFRSGVVIAFIFSAVPTFFITYYLSVNNFNDNSMNFFGFIKNYSYMGNIIGFDNLTSLIKSIYIIFTFLLFHFLLTWIALFMVLKNIKNDKKSNLFLGVILSTTIFNLIILIFFDISAGSGYYFSNVSQFIALFIILSMTKYFNKYFSSVFIITTIIIVLLPLIFFNTQLGLEKSKLYRNSPILHLDLIDKLISIKNKSNINTIFEVGGVYEVGYDKWRCLPFVFPAVSERPWIGVINIWADCSYKYFGYDSYRINDHGVIKWAPPVIGDNFKLEKLSN